MALDPRREKQIEGIKRARDAKEIRGVDHAQQVRSSSRAWPSSSAYVRASRLVVRGGDSGRVASAIKKAGGPSIDKRTVQIAKPIKTVGSHTVGVKLHRPCAHVPVSVVAVLTYSPRTALMCRRVGPDRPDRAAVGRRL